MTRTPLTLITGPLGSGKTTLLRHILETTSRRIAILMNEFGEMAIDSKIVAGKNVRMAELGGGCVCCSLIGEFEAAVNEVIDAVDPEVIVVETTGVAEPDALIFDIQESLPRVRLDGVITVADADGMLRYPQLGRTTRMQIGDADTILLNKIDLAGPGEVEALRKKLETLNGAAAVLLTRRCRADPDLLFGIGRERKIARPQHLHQPDYESFSYRTRSTLQRACFEKFAAGLGREVYRAKGFVRLPEGTHLFNFVAGRWELEAFRGEETELVFIGRGIGPLQEKIAAELRRCEA